MADTDEDLLEQEEEEQDDEQQKKRSPSIAGRIAQSDSITGMPPLAPAPAAPVPAPSGKSIAGGAAINTPPPPSVTGAPPIVNAQPPEPLSQPSILPGAAPTSPNLPQDVLAGRVQAPNWRDYKPQHVGMGRKIAAGILGGLAGLHDPNLGAETTRSIAYGPQLSEFRGDTQQFEHALGAGQQQQAQQKEGLGEDLTRAQTAHLGAETEALKNPQPKPTEEDWGTVPGIQGPNGEPVQQEKHSGQVRVMPLSGALVTEKNKPSEQDKEVSDYLAAHKLPDTPENREKARSAVRAELRPPKDTTGREDARADRSYQFHSTQLEKLRTPIETRMERIGIAIDNLNQKSPQADALAAPEILTALVGGQGSGLRMNEAEISRIIGGATAWTQLKTQLNKWSLDPQHVTFTDEQRGQMQKILATAREKIIAKQKVIEDAEEKLASSTDPQEHRQILKNVRKGLDAADAGTAGSKQEIQEGAHGTWKGKPVVRHNGKWELEQAPPQTQ